MPDCCSRRGSAIVTYLGPCLDVASLTLSVLSHSCPHSSPLVPVPAPGSHHRPQYRPFPLSQLGLVRRGPLASAAALASRTSAAAAWPAAPVAATAAAVTVAAAAGRRGRLGTRRRHRTAPSRPGSPGRRRWSRTGGARAPPPEKPPAAPPASQTQPLAPRTRHRPKVSSLAAAAAADAWAVWGTVAAPPVAASSAWAAEREGPWARPLADA